MIEAGIYVSVSGLCCHRVLFNEYHSLALSPLLYFDLDHGGDSEMIYRSQD